MKLSFRQGLVSYDKNGLGQPTYLGASSTSGWVAIRINPSPVVVTFAHGKTDYLVSFSESVEQAWQLVSGQTNHLFWEVDLLTGVVTRGVTTLEPVAGLVAPVTPVQGQMWFDQATTKMKVWTGDHWREVIRVIAGRVANGNISQLVARQIGSQVGLDVASGGIPNDVEVGYIMYDTKVLPPRPLRQTNGEFLTSATEVRIQTSSETSGVLAMPPTTIIPVRAAQNIPKFSAVALVGSDLIGLASSDAVNPRDPIGIVTEDLSTNEIGNLVTTGEVSWDQWPFDLSNYVGKPVYIDQNGQLTPVRPASLMASRVGFVKNANTVIFRVDAETIPQVYQASSNDFIINGNSPVQASFAISPLGERVWTVGMPAATPLSNGYATAVQVTTLGQHETRITDAEVLLATKAAINHTHTIANVTGLPAELAGIQQSLTLKADKVIGNVAGNFAGLSIGGNLTDSGFGPSSFTLVGHTHTIPDVVGLQTALNGKADTVHSHAIAAVTGLQQALDDVNTTLATKITKISAATVGAFPLMAIDGSLTTSTFTPASFALSSHTHLAAQITDLAPLLAAKSNVGHTHVAADITDLAPLLAAKSNVGHAHAIGDVSGLQLALDERAPLNHTHVFADIPGLVAALDGKAPFSHSHVIADTTGLQAALDGKAPAMHTHAIADVTLLQTELNRRLATDNTTTYSPTGDFNPATKKYVDDALLGYSIGSINNHTDVDTSSTPPTNGQFLRWDSSDSQWKPAAIPGSSPIPIDALTDVDTTTVAPSNGQLLRWNGTNWVPSTETAYVPGSINALTDVDTATTLPVNGDVLKWNGTQWIPGTGASGDVFVFKLSTAATPGIHQHAASLSLADAMQLVRTTDTSLAVGAVGQPFVSVTTTTEQAHNHTFNVYFDYINNTFVGTNLNPTTNHTHTISLVGDGVGSGGATTSFFKVLQTDRASQFISRWEDWSQIPIVQGGGFGNSPTGTPGIIASQSQLQFQNVATNQSYSTTYSNTASISAGFNLTFSLFREQTAGADGIDFGVTLQTFSPSMGFPIPMSLKYETFAVSGASDNNVLILSDWDSSISQSVELGRAAGNIFPVTSADTVISVITNGISVSVVVNGVTVIGPVRLATSRTESGTVATGVELTCGRGTFTESTTTFNVAPTFGSLNTYTYSTQFTITGEPIAAPEYQVNTAAAHDRVQFTNMLVSTSQQTNVAARITQQTLTLTNNSSSIAAYPNVTNGANAIVLNFGTGLRATANVSGDVEVTGGSVESVTINFDLI